MLLIFRDPHKGSINITFGGFYKYLIGKARGSCVFTTQFAQNEHQGFLLSHLEFSISFENTGNIGFIYSAHKNYNIFKKENQIKT